MKKCAPFLSCKVFLVVLLHSLQIYMSSSEFIEADRIDDINFYYKPAIFDKSNINITLAVIAPITRTRGTADFEFTAGSLLAIVCQADQINQKYYPELDFEGQINIAIQDYDIEDPIGQYSSMQILKNSLYSRNTNLTLSDGTDNALVKAVIKLVDITYNTITILILLYYHPFYKAWQFNEKQKKLLNRQTRPSTT